MNREISSRNHEPPASEAGKRGSMQRSEALILEAIPLLMGGVCLGFGLYVWHSQNSPPFFMAGHVVTFLAAICLALFCTAATIIQQLIGRYNAFYRVFVAGAWLCNRRRDLWLGYPGHQRGFCGDRSHHCRPRCMRSRPHRHLRLYGGGGIHALFPDPAQFQVIVPRSPSRGVLA